MVNMEDKIYTISSEKEALEYLISNNNNAVVIIGWDKWQLKIIGDGFNGTLDIHIIQALLELQKSIYRFYAYTKYGIPDIKRLAQEEKNRLKISISVEKGSTDINIELIEVIKQAISNMSPEHTYYAITTGILLFFGGQYFRYWLKCKTTNKKLELEAKDSELNLEKDRLYTTLLEKITSNNNENIKNICNLAQEKDKNILRNLKNTRADCIEYQNEQMTPDSIKEVLKTDKITKDQRNIRLDGIYKVLSINYEDENQVDFKLEVVKVSNLKDKEIIYASYSKEEAARTDISFKPVENRDFSIEINGVMLDEIIEEALIVSIKDIH